MRKFYRHLSQDLTLYLVWDSESETSKEGTIWQPGCLCTMRIQIVQGANIAQEKKEIWEFPKQLWVIRERRWWGNPLTDVTHNFPWYENYCKVDLCLISLRKLAPRPFYVRFLLLKRRQKKRREAKRLRERRRRKARKVRVRAKSQEGKEGNWQGKGTTRKKGEGTGTEERAERKGTREQEKRTWGWKGKASWTQEGDTDQIISTQFQISPKGFIISSSLFLKSTTSICCQVATQLTSKIGEVRSRISKAQLMFDPKMWHCCRIPGEEGFSTHWCKFIL